jgi:ATP-binding cassette subfamily B protein
VRLKQDAAVEIEKTSSGYDAYAPDLQSKALRQQMSFVLQESLLFHGPVSQNIAYGKPGASRSEILRAAELANANEFIEKMPEGYDAIIGEKGVTLSGGQRQRIGYRPRCH